MLFAFLRRAALRHTTGSRRRVPTTRKPCVEPLEARDVPAILTLPQTDVPTFTATYNTAEPGVGPIQISGAPLSGGNFLGTLNGHVPLKASYCVNIDLQISPGTTYANAALTRDGTVYGAAVPNAGQVAWLLTHFGPTATTPAQQDALQAAIWRTEYGSGFQLDGVDNHNGAPSFNAAIAPIYQADLAGLGKNTAPVSSVDWISPGTNPGLPVSSGQALVALEGQAPPQVTGIAPIHSRKRLTGFTVGFDEAMNPASATNRSLYRVLAAVKIHHQLVFRQVLKIRSITYEAATNSVTITLAKPHKGKVQLTAANGILATDGLGTASPFSAVVQ